jgi:hypothetical protein
MTADPFVTASGSVQQQQKFAQSTTADCSGNRARAVRVTHRQRAKIDCKKCTIYLGKSVTCDITAYTLHRPQPMIKWVPWGAL